jgi:DNA-binding beta-propeller fold protein YncE
MIAIRLTALVGLLSATFSAPIQAQTAPTFLDQWGTLGSGAGQFRYPYGIAVAADGTVLVTDQYNFRIQEFGPGGEFIRSWGSQGTGPGQFGIQIGVAVDSNGLVYVADYGNERIQVFTLAGAFVRQFGNAQLEPRYIAVAPNGQIYVAALTVTSLDVPGAVFVYDPSGNLRRRFGRFDSPVAIAFAPDGTVWVADEGNQDMTQFSGDGGTMLSHVPFYPNIPLFAGPAGMCISGTGTIYLCDYADGRVVMLTPSAQYLASFGGLGSLPGQLSSAADVALGPDGICYVVDLLGCRIERFGNGVTPTKSMTWGQVKAAHR